MLLANTSSSLSGLRIHLIFFCACFSHHVIKLEFDLVPLIKTVSSIDDNSLYIYFIYKTIIPGRFYACRIRNVSNVLMFCSRIDIVRSFLLLKA